MTTRITVCKWFSLLSLTNIGLILGSFFTLCYSSGLTILPIMLSSKLIFKKRTLEINDSVTRSPKIQPHRNTVIPIFLLAFPGGLVEKNPLANEGDIWDLGLIPGSGRFPQVGHGSPVQHSCLENPMNTGAWRATVHRASKSQTQLKWFHVHTHIFLLLTSPGLPKVLYLGHLPPFTITPPVQHPIK